MVLDERLLGPVSRRDLAGWNVVMPQVIDEVVADASAAARRGALCQLSWCGERRALTMAPAASASSLAQRVRGLWRALWPDGGRQRWPGSLQDL